MKLKVEIEKHALSGTPPHCDCCGRTHMNMTFKLYDDSGLLLNLGVICTGKWFGGSYTGNNSKSLKRLVKRINTMHDMEWENILDRIEAQRKEREDQDE